MDEIVRKLFLNIFQKDIFSFFEVYKSVKKIFGEFGTSNVQAEEQIQYHPKFKTPAYIGEEWKAPEGVDKKESVFQYLESKKAMFKLAGNVEKHFKIVGEEKDEKSETTHIKLVEKYNDIPVYGSDQTITFDKENNVKAFFGQVIPNLEDKKYSDCNEHYG